MSASSIIRAGWRTRQRSVGPVSDETSSWPQWLRRLAALAALGATAAVGRNRAIAANEKRYRVLQGPAELGTGSAGSAGAGNN